LDRAWPILAAKSAKNDPNLAPQNDSKSTKNRCKKTIEFLIELRTRVPQFLSRPGGMRWPPGGIVGGAKNLHFEMCRCLRHIWALRCTDFAVGLAHSAPPLRGGRRIQTLHAFRRSNQKACQHIWKLCIMIVFCGLKTSVALGFSGRSWGGSEASWSGLGASWGNLGGL